MPDNFDPLDDLADLYYAILHPRGPVPDEALFPAGRLMRALGIGLDASRDEVKAALGKALGLDAEGKPRQAPGLPERAAEAATAPRTRHAGTMPPPTHPFAGTSKARQEVGKPGHCEKCAQVGHVRAHPSLGCGDVGCERAHGPDDPADAR